LEAAGGELGHMGKKKKRTKRNKGGVAGLEVTTIQTNKSGEESQKREEEKLFSIRKEKGRKLWAFELKKRTFFQKKAKAAKWGGKRGK